MTLTGCQVAGSSESPSRRNHIGAPLREWWVRSCAVQRNASRITAYPTAYRLVAAMGSPPPTGDDGPCAIQAYWSPVGTQTPRDGSYRMAQASGATRQVG